MKLSLCSGFEFHNYLVTFVLRIVDQLCRLLEYSADFLTTVYCRREFDLRPHKSDTRCHGWAMSALPQLSVHRLPLFDSSTRMQGYTMPLSYNVSRGHSVNMSLTDKEIETLDTRRIVRLHSLRLLIYAGSL